MRRKAAQPERIETPQLEIRVRSQVPQTAVAGVKQIDYEGGSATNVTPGPIPFFHQIPLHSDAS